MPRYVFPLDPKCPEVVKHYKMIDEDDFGHVMGAPYDDINEDFERKHRANCQRCQEYGAANVDID